MDHPYTIEQLNKTHLAEMQQAAAARRLAKSMTVSQPGVFSRMLARFHRAQPAVTNQDVLTTQEILALNANRTGR